MVSPPSVPPMSWPGGRRPDEMSRARCAATAALILGIPVWLAIAHHWAWITLSPLAWLVFCLASRERMRPVLRQIDRQLDARPSFPAHLWGGPERAEMAAFVARLIAEEGGWPNHHFAPDDPLDLLLFCPLGDGAEGLVVFYEIEKRVGRKVPFEPGRTFGELVDSCRAGSGPA